MQHLHLVSQQLVKMEVPENHQVPEDIGMLPIQLMKTPDAGSSFSFSTVGIKMEIPENLQVLENTGILPMEILTTPDPLSSLSFLAMERKIEIPENIQAPEDIGISPIGFTNNFKKPPKTKRTRRSHCKETTQILQAYFETSHHPSGLQMAQLAEVTGLNNKQVKAWFSNKRRSMRVQQMREEKEKAKVWKMITPGSPVRSPGIASPSSIFPKYQITAEASHM
ncbi:hypothetical protein L5515_019539 [Caenorhabditis briggsae]|uniref:Homeobox domain-containing protein n=1 Tax=Caenorhabditis briggsae TaxID=6238 RepID=A0AAE9JVJ5_CAEBR|nr:hypothetical protein L5515_019539 [Caenorhabditis briggsae]